MTKQSLRELLIGLSDKDQQTLVMVAFQAISDVEFCAEVAELLGVQPQTLSHDFGERVASPLDTVAQHEAGWHPKQKNETNVAN